MFKAIGVIGLVWGVIAYNGASDLTDHVKTLKDTRTAALEEATKY